MNDATFHLSALAFDPLDEDEEHAFATVTNDCPDEAAAWALYRLISDISEEHYFAGWMMGIEYELFDAAFAGESIEGFLLSERGLLLSLAFRCDGWWMSGPDLGSSIRFVDMATWLESYVEYVKR